MIIGCSHIPDVSQCFHYQAPNDEICNLFTIPAAAVQSHIKAQSVAKSERARGTVASDDRAALGEMFDTESFRCKQGYLIKNGNSAAKWMAAKKKEKTVDNDKENKKTGEAWLKRSRSLA